MSFHFEGMGAKPSMRKKAGVALLFGGLGVLFAIQCAKVVRLKVRQHMLLIPEQPALPQGDTPGKVPTLVALQAFPDGGFLTLSKDEKGYLLQRFRSDLSLDAARTFPSNRDPGDWTLVGMAALPGGGVALSELTGRLQFLDQTFAAKRQLQLSTDLGAMTASPDGTLYVLTPLEHCVESLAKVGLGPTQEFGAAHLKDPQAIARTASGALVVLDKRPDGYSLQVFGSDGSFKRSIKAPQVIVAPSVTVAPAGGEWVVLNNASNVGVFFYDSRRGTFCGSAWGDSQTSFYPAFAFEFPGFVGGDARTGDVYVHFSPGLLKCRLPKS